MTTRERPCDSPAVRNRSIPQPFYTKFLQRPVWRRANSGKVSGPFSPPRVGADLARFSPRSMAGGRCRGDPSRTRAGSIHPVGRGQPSRRPCDGRPRLAPHRRAARRIRQPSPGAGRGAHFRAAHPGHGVTGGFRGGRSRRVGRGVPTGAIRPERGLGISAAGSARHHRRAAGPRQVCGAGGATGPRARLRPGGVVRSGAARQRHRRRSGRDRPGCGCAGHRAGVGHRSRAARRTRCDSRVDHWSGRSGCADDSDRRTGGCWPPYVLHSDCARGAIGRIRAGVERVLRRGWISAGRPRRPGDLRVASRSSRHHPRRAGERRAAAGRRTHHALPVASRHDRRPSPRRGVRGAFRSPAKLPSPSDRCGPTSSAAPCCARASTRTAWRRPSTLAFAGQEAGRRPFAALVRELLGLPADHTTHRFPAASAGAGMVREAARQPLEADGAASRGGCRGRGRARTGVRPG